MKKEFFNNLDESTFINTRSNSFYQSKVLKLKNLKMELEKKKDLLFFSRKKKNLNEPDFILKKLSEIVKKMVNLKNIKKLENLQLSENIEEIIFQKQNLYNKKIKIDKIINKDISIFSRKKIVRRKH